MKFIQNSLLTLIFRLILGSIFIYAAVDKIIDPHGFASDIRNYDFIPHMLSNLPAIILPWIELYCGFSLVIGLYTRSSASIIAVLLILFIFAIVFAMLRGLDIECGCYRTFLTASKVGIGKLVEDILLFIMALLIINSKSVSFGFDKILIRS